MFKRLAILTLTIAAQSPALAWADDPSASLLYRREPIYEKLVESLSHLGLFLFVCAVLFMLTLLVRRKRGAVVENYEILRRRCELIMVPSWVCITPLCFEVSRCWPFSGYDLSLLPVCWFICCAGLLFGGAGFAHEHLWGAREDALRKTQPLLLCGVTGLVLVSLFTLGFEERVPRCRHDPGVLHEVVF